MKQMRIPSPEEKEAYDRICAESTKKWNLARAEASQIFSQAQKAANDACWRDEIDTSTCICLITKALFKCEAAENKANRESYSVRMNAWKKYILGEVGEEKTEQLALW